MRPTQGRVIAREQPSRQVRQGRTATGKREREYGNAYHRQSKWFNDAKGFGFITPEAGRRIASSIIPPSRATASRRWPRGERVEFDIVQGQKGPAAENVTKLDG